MRKRFEDGDLRPATVIAIIKLGEERPTDFTKANFFEVWSNLVDGTVYWKDYDGDICFANRDGLPQAIRGRQASNQAIHADMHRVGVVTGVLVDGKPWPFKD